MDGRIEDAINGHRDTTEALRIGSRTSRREQPGGPLVRVPARPRVIYWNNGTSRVVVVREERPASGVGPRLRRDDPLAGVVAHAAHHRVLDYRDAVDPDLLREIRTGTIPRLTSVMPAPQRRLAQIIRPMTAVRPATVQGRRRAAAGVSQSSSAGTHSSRSSSARAIGRNAELEGENVQVPPGSTQGTGTARPASRLEMVPSPTQTR